jgi:hypothetical protein
VNPGGRNSRSEILARFGVRSFRFQFLADLLTSWAGEIENPDPRLVHHHPDRIGAAADRVWLAAICRRADRAAVRAGGGSVAPPVRHDGSAVVVADLREGMAYVWDTPASLAAMWLALLVKRRRFR